jgi:D-sedoheptulose 7-phosphate isomerase
MNSDDRLKKARRLLEESAQVKLKAAELLTTKIVKASDLILEAYENGGKVIIFGNGGSAADAQHMASELTGRFMMERVALPAIALTTDTSTLTAISNDYGFENVFSRQVEALSKQHDIVIAISTSGRSENILTAIDAAKKKGIITLGLTGESGGALANRVDLCINVPSQNTPRIQEAHITIIHIICQLVEQGLFEK